MIDDEKATALDTLVDEVETLLQQGYRFVTAFCIDQGENLEIIYLFGVDHSMRSLRLVFPKETEVPSITSIYPGAILIEKEMQELFGAKIIGIDAKFVGRFLVTMSGLQMPHLNPLVVTDVAINPN